MERWGFFLRLQKTDRILWFWGVEMEGNGRIGLFYLGEFGLVFRNGAIGRIKPGVFGIGFKKPVFGLDWKDWDWIGVWGVVVAFGVLVRWFIHFGGAGWFWVVFWGWA